MITEEHKDTKEQFYMNEKTGSVDTAENWIAENSEKVLDDLIEVVKNPAGDWVEVE